MADGVTLSVIAVASLYFCTDPYSPLVWLPVLLAILAISVGLIGTVKYAHDHKEDE